jgi:hypothetical protein
MASRRPRTCADCGLPTFFNHYVYTSDEKGQRVWHGGPQGCESAAKAIERLPAMYDATIQALVEI